MTFVFASGVSAVILPIAFGATALSRLINAEHTVVYSVMALVMMVMGVAMAMGVRLPMPMIGIRPRQGSGPGAVFLLGAFSGVATACCAPVLAGVIALSGAAMSFPTALMVGIAYVFGMVAPLFVVALVWDGRELGATKWLGARSVRMRIFGTTRDLPLASLLGGVLLVVMGVVVGVLAVTGPDMATRGWQATISNDAQYYAHLAITVLEHFPGWVTTVVIFCALAALALRAVRQAAEPTLAGGDLQDSCAGSEDEGAQEQPLVDASEMPPGTGPRLERKEKP